MLLPLFVCRERRAAAPLLDLHLFRIPAFTGGVIGVNLSYALLYSMFFLMSFAFVRGLHASPISAGLHLAIVPRPSVWWRRSVGAFMSGWERES